ncbi:hypothetical protein P154DRAFT_544074 [Amniculicola lignicola CBS 123094]|uniref:Protein PBN1 n=1 Tax=Amniculicola lignicola CBS 123094 TaxID=1392246 RepID=A0A6A5WPQ6_9PLEO|nr:hypothetical protein P154DRAFT_544074 [Amniculicola lignicola CBS 123094]
MRVVPWLACFVTHVWTVNANVEKTVFLAPGPATLPDAHPGLDTLRLATLSPALRPVLPTVLSVQFPSDSAPRGLESWYLLRGLEEGRRYEVRICWPATQPTDFWLDTFTLTHVWATPKLIVSLAKYSQQQQQQQHARGSVDSSVDQEETLGTSQSTLFLRIQAAASFFSSNHTLMEHPPPVDADIILDPFILNVLPRSLAPFAAYISVVAVGAWLLSGYVYRWLLSHAVEAPAKPHTD